MLQKVRNYIQDQHMILPGDGVIVALSGGADSVCLLVVLKKLAQLGLQCQSAGVERQVTEPETEKEHPCFALRAVHVNHGIRGAEADRDEAFARELCRTLQVPFIALHCQVPEYAAEHGLSEEEAGRILRYQILEAQAEAWEREFLAEHRVKIALAHHRNDNAETILHHLLRGSGLTGLAGIRPVQERRIRPLLGVGRGEIREYLNAEGIGWCEDSTNQSGDYTRNRIRNEVLPLLKDAVNAQAEEHILQAGQIIGQADTYLADQAAEIWRTSGKLYGKEKRDASCDSGNRDLATCWDSEKQAAKDCIRAEIPLATIRTQPDILKTYLIRHMLNLIHPGWKNITSRHFYQITELAEKQVGSRIDLPGGLIAMLGYETLVLTRNTGPDMAFRKTEAAGPGYGEEYSLEMDQALHMTVFSRQKDQEIPKNQYTKWFDYDKIKGTLSVRTRRTGDYLILPSGGKKTIARFMIDEKIPKEERDHILLLAEDDHVLWVVGYRISEYYKIDNKTQNILQVTCDGGKDYGR
ncbi:tRNA lysidine(34) synthetase TilS [Clostridium sp. OM02-18AC]|uniref:tRNA lysidine(34) synthetase TilS n=1 Tax=Clostridium sp. OM02-18AC TaxID=2292311 RepID=UPI000E48473F|nr:tRNA lysidine(34) synthetase TilS [Clostridium sp. OM02-18AC]RHV65665.1 tRNA lysidine(34) synthetase TilS [Clostridium sp. OM02-18AC]